MSHPSYKSDPDLGASVRDHLSSIGNTWVLSNMGVIGAFLASNAFGKKNGDK